MPFVAVRGPKDVARLVVGDDVVPGRVEQRHGEMERQAGREGDGRGRGHAAEAQGAAGQRKRQNGSGEKGQNDAHREGREKR